MALPSSASPHAAEGGQGDSAPPGPGRARLASVLLSAATIVVLLGILLAAEGLLRVLDPDYLEDDPAAGLSRLHRYSETYGWELRPGFRSERGGKQITVNALGYRGDEHPLEPSPDRPRVVMLGDSLAFGYEVADAETFSAIIEAGRRYEVVNLSVPGYGTDQELIRLQAEGMRYHPDIVILNFCIENDFVDNVCTAFFYDGLHPKPYFRLVGGGLLKYDDQLRRSFPTRLALWLRERSHLYNRLFHRAPIPHGADWARRMDEALRDRDAAVALTAALIGRINGVAAAGGASFLALVYPNKTTFKGGSPMLEALLGSGLLGGATVIDMAERYRARSLLFHDLALDAMGHLSPAGHRVTAQIIEELLPASKPRPEGERPVTSGFRPRGPLAAMHARLRKPRCRSARNGRRESG